MMKTYNITESQFKEIKNINNIGNDLMTAISQFKDIATNNNFNVKIINK